MVNETDITDIQWVNASNEVREIAESIRACFSDVETEGFVQKKSFSPSRLAWGSGGCPRNWYFLFHGVQGKRVDSSDSLDTMQNGSDSHARIQKRIMDGDVDAVCEEQLQFSDPPINSYCDVIVNHKGKRVPIEIKTSKSEAFAYRHTSVTPAEYHVFQLLVYMKILETDVGFIMYENKNDYKKIMMPVYMTPENKKIVDDAFEWMRKVKAASDKDKLPKYFKGRRANSKICKDCDLKALCDSVGEGVVDLPLLKDAGE